MAVWFADHARRLQHQLEQAERKSERLGVFVSERRRTPTRTLTPISLQAFGLKRPGAEAKRPPVEASSLGVRRDETHGTLVTEYLDDVRDRLGADEVVLWRKQGEAGVAAVAWSGAHGGRPAASANGMTSGGASGGASAGADAPTEPPRFRSDVWLPLVEWSARQRLLQCEREGDAVTFAVTPVADETRGYCALSVSSASPMKASLDKIKALLPRAGAHAAELAELVHTVRQYERQVRQANVLVNSAKMFQSKRSVDGLGQTVCRDALQITAGERAALIKWDGELRVGYVQGVSPGHSLEPGQRVAADSVVGECCTEDQSQTWEDGRALEGGRPVYGAEVGASGAGSLMVVTLKQEQRVVGAIAVEGSAPHALSARDIGPVRTLAAIASASLQQLWRMEEVHKASITDPLTRLYNRRHFDDQLVRLLYEADKSGHPVSLILIDADHFKQVNDRYGHESGDAVLVSIADTVRRTVRLHDLCARFGGEELAVVLPNTPIIEALELAERLRRALAAKPVVHGGMRISVTASFGVSSYPETVSTHGAIFPAADRALYQAKSAGRNCVKSNSATDDFAETFDAVSPVVSERARG